MLSKRSIITYAIAFVFILLLNFLLPRMMPGDPLMAIYGDEALIAMTPELKASLVEHFALDKPLWQQLGAYFLALFQGELGYSYYYNAPVLSVILGRLPWTLLLVGTSLVLSTMLGIILGIESGWRRGSRTDRTMLAGLMSLNGFPDFFLGMLLLITFGVTWGIFLIRISPAAGRIEALIPASSCYDSGLSSQWLSAHPKHHDYSTQRTVHAYRQGQGLIAASTQISTCRQKLYAPGGYTSRYLGGQGGYRGSLC